MSTDAAQGQVYYPVFSTDEKGCQHRAKGIVPAPVRAGSIGWKKLMSHYREQLLACDFFQVETIWLKTLTVFFFIDIGTRQVYLAGITDHPNGHWITQ